LELAVRSVAVSSAINTSAEDLRIPGDLGGGRPQALANSNFIRSFSFVHRDELNAQELLSITTALGLPGGCKYFCSLAAVVQPSMQSTPHRLLVDLATTANDAVFIAFSECTCHGGASGTCSHCMAFFIMQLCTPFDHFIVSNAAYDLHRERNVCITSYLSAGKKRRTDVDQSRYDNVDAGDDAVPEERPAPRHKNVQELRGERFMPVKPMALQRAKFVLGMMLITDPDGAPITCPILSCGKRYKFPAPCATHIMRYHTDWQEYSSIRGENDVETKAALELYLRNKSLAARLHRAVNDLQ
jgi:hypothetical protein